MTPVTVNTGVVIGATVPSVRFDWYQASFPSVDLEEFLGQFLADHELASITHRRGETHGYERAWNVKRGDDVLISVFEGGNQGAPLNAWASGSGSPEFATWARDRFPGHYVTRGDAAMDMDRPGAWDQLQDLFFDLRNGFPRVQTSVVGDLFGGKKGTTLNFGSGKSQSHIRFYQKGLQVPEFGRPHWVRAEFQVRPKGEERYAFARLPAVDFWRYTKWSRLAFERLRGFDPGEVVRETHRRTGFEMRWAAMIKQYGKTISEARQRLGSDEALGAALVAGELPQNLSL